MKWEDLFRELNTVRLTDAENDYIKDLYFRASSDEIDLLTYMKIAKRFNLKKDIPSHDAKTESSEVPTNTSRAYLADDRMPSNSAKNLVYDLSGNNHSMSTQYISSGLPSQTPLVSTSKAKPTTSTLLPVCVNNRKLERNDYSLDFEELVSAPTQPTISSTQYLSEADKILKFVNEQDEDDEEKSSVKDEEVCDYVYRTFLKSELKDMHSAHIKMEKILGDLTPAVDQLRQKLQTVSDECDNTCKYHLKHALGLKKQKKTIVRRKVEKM